MAIGGIPWGELDDPPLDGALDVPDGHCPAFVANGGDPTGVGVDCPGPNTQRDYIHPGRRTPVDPLEGGRGAHRHAS